MKHSEFKSYDDLPLFLNATTVAGVLGIAPTSSYELMHVVAASSVSCAPPQAAGLLTSLRLLYPQSQRAALRGPRLIFPVLKIGNRLVVPKEKFIQWVDQHTQGGAG